MQPFTVVHLDIFPKKMYLFRLSNFPINPVSTAQCISNQMFCWYDPHFLTFQSNFHFMRGSGTVRGGLIQTQLTQLLCQDLTTPVVKSLVQLKQNFLTQNPTMLDSVVFFPCLQFGTAMLISTSAYPRLLNLRLISFAAQGLYKNRADPFVLFLSLFCSKWLREHCLY